MDSFWQNVTISLVTGFITGIIAGVLTGLISGYFVTRMARFGDLRNEARRIVWGIEFMYSGGNMPQIRENRPVGQLVYISAELYSLKHKRAGDTVATLRREITETLRSPPINPAEMNEKYTNWQQICRELRPNWCSLLSLNFTKI